MSEQRKFAPVTAPAILVRSLGYCALCGQPVSATVEGDCYWTDNPDDNELARPLHPACAVSYYADQDVQQIRSYRG